MHGREAKVVVIGGGIIGLSVAHCLISKFGISGVVLVEKNGLMNLTSAVSTGGYRNYFPADEKMTQFVTRSIKRLEALAQESSNGFLFYFYFYFYFSLISFYYH